MAIESNKLLVASSVLFVGVASASVYNYMQKDESTGVDYSVQQKAPAVYSDGGDGTADTIRTLTAAVEVQAERQRELEAINKRQSEELEKTLKALAASDKRSKRAIDGALQQYEVRQQQQSKGLMSALTSLQSKVSDIGRLEQKPQEKAVTEVIPDGFGLGNDRPEGIYDESLKGMWILPNGVEPAMQSNGKAGGGKFTPLSASSRNARSAKASDAYTSQADRASIPKPSAVKAEAPPPAVEPYFTIPDMSALSGAVTTTALIGEVYTDVVKDPFPFKVSVGRSNMAASFAELPDEIVGMIFEGYAIGKWSASCVTGKLVAASFVFDSGEIVSAYVGDKGTRPTKAQISANTIGYIADEYGNPCILGTRHTDAPRSIGLQTLAAGVDGYAAALADAEVSTTIDGTAISDVVTGEVDNYAGAKALQSGASETADLLRRRAAQYIDTVYVRSGVKVAVHTSQEIRIDKDRAGRKVRYNQGAFRHAGLD